MAKIGIIGGSGLYKLESLKKIKKIELRTPFGNPSDAYVTGVIDGKEVVFLPRHGIGHRILPSELNYRANIYGMKKLGVDTLLSIGAVGSLKEEIRPLDMVVVDQFVDRTNQARKVTFFGDGIVAHPVFADPVCPELSKILFLAGKSTGVTIHRGGTYLNMEGPLFSTRAESNLYRSWGMDVIGMTNMPEARLAREAQMCYASLAMVTDYDCWREGESVTLEMILDNLNRNADAAKMIIRKVVSTIGGKKSCGCGESMRYAIVTDKSKMPAKKKKELELLIGKFL